MTRCFLIVRAFVMFGIGSLPTLFAQTPGNPVVQVSNSACTPSGGGIGDGPGGVTFERVADGAKAIVEAYVQSMEPAGPSARGGPVPRNDVLLLASRVLKGPESLGQFAVDQIRASGFFEMRPGQHFILFLNEPGPGLLQLFPERPGVPRYNAVLAAILCVDGGKVRVSPEGNYMKARFEGVELEKAVTDIRSYVRLSRVSGRIVIDGGTFPPSGTLFAVPRYTFDRPGNLKLVLTPAIAPGSAPRPTIATHANPNTGIGAPPPALESSASLNSGPRRTFIDRGGAFTLPMAAGTYRVTVDGLPFGYDVKSISYGSRDLLREPLVVDGLVSSELVVTLTNKPTAIAPAGVRVSGRVTDIPAGVRRDSLWVVLNSDAEENVRSGAAQPLQDGTFEFLNVPPGTYTLQTIPEALGPSYAPGVVWGGASIVSVSVTSRDIPVELPLFGGVAITARIVDVNGNIRSTNPPARLTFLPTIGTPGTQTYVNAAPDGTFRLWLPRGEYAVDIPYNTRATYGIISITSGSVDLRTSRLKIDGVTPVAPIVITLVN